MTEDEKYLFDLQGFLLVKQAISADVLSVMNLWIEEREKEAPEWRNNYPSILAWGLPFQNLLDNDKILPYLVELMGDELRLDHDYAIFAKGDTPGGGLHGGSSPYDPAQYYHNYRGRMYSGLTVASYALTDALMEDGGFACIPGSHKASFPLPSHYHSLDNPTAVVMRVPVQAGDCVLFTEALTHGTLPWKAEHQRRNLFLKYSPKHLSWADRYYYPAEGNSVTRLLENKLTDNQRALLAPPSVHNHPQVHLHSAG